MNQKNQEVQEYYGKTLQSSTDLKTNACCTIDAYPKYVRQIFPKIHSEVMDKYYGCGLVIPEELEGTKVLDLGSGSGRDCYILGAMVGEKGQVVGVDMTKEQLDVANKHIDYHTEKFGYKSSNVSFLEGNIEKLDELDLAPNSFDIVISNCVINLVEDKQKVLKDTYNLLKEGGEFYFSDVYCDRRIPKHLVDDQVLYGECLSGALYWNDFQNMAKVAGFTDPRVVESSVITIQNEEVQKKLKGYNFYSVTYRLFKLPQLETHCEEYGQAVRYRGGIPHFEEKFDLDGHHPFMRGKIESVCGNTFTMLKDTRFEKYFDFMGDFETHYGIYEGCGFDNPFSGQETSGDPSACC